jgi:Rrf2 family nitric oxide-sensitive transcriptional repressor
MQLSLHAEYALRVLLYLGTKGERPVVSTMEISRAYGISKHHLVRVMHTLNDHGYVRLIPGRAGGVVLDKIPAQIRLGDVVRNSEPTLRLAECFDRKTNTCCIAPVCSLRPVLKHALEAFLDSLNRHTLADLLADGAQERMADKFLQLESQAS